MALIIARGPGAGMQSKPSGEPGNFRGEPVTCEKAANKKAKVGFKG
jgi:hypothetical protein